ncbi:MAG TPA: BMC domain-containing protein [Myxococcota bacterium]|nr:BMC domain-containing protein [Myxococcota bacterium]
MSGTGDALALVELDSIARGYRVLDAMVKRSPVEILEANLVEPGKYLILFAGGVAEVEESYSAALEAGAGHHLDAMLLPMVHGAIVPGLRGYHNCEEPDTIGVIEATSVAAMLESCDRSLKDAEVVLAGLRLTPALGGKAFFVVHGEQADVEAAAEIAGAVLLERKVQIEVIARPHEDFLAYLLRPAPFRVET